MKHLTSANSFFANASWQKACYLFNRTCIERREVPDRISRRFRSHHSTTARHLSEAGVALFLVVAVIALTSIVVLNLTYTTTLENRSNRSVEQALQAEYLLKSALNLARTLIHFDQTPNIDGKQDIWADGILPFTSGATIPNQLLGVTDPGVRIQMMIQPVDSKIPIQHPGGVFRDVLQRLFDELGFDNDGEVDHTGLMPGKILDSKEMVAALIDYIDNETPPVSYNKDGYQGIESQLGDKSPCRNDGKIRRVGELTVIPGYTPARMQLISKYTRVRGSQKININLAPEIVLRVLDPDLTEPEIESILAYRETNSFGDQYAQLADDLKANTSVSQSNQTKLVNFLDMNSSYFYVIAKVEYSSSAFFMIAYVTQGTASELPKVDSIEFL